MDADGLAAVLHRHASRHAVPGAALGVIRDGVAAVACFGVADEETREPVTPATRFSVGSLTKSMVATAAARLAAAGVLALDDPVAEHVPELRGAGWARRARLADLLANRSGVPLRADLEFGFDARTDQDDAALARFAADIGAADPGPPIWSYSNAGWCLLGRATETATGAPWEQAMRRHLFEPLGLTETAFRGEAAALPLASGHERSEGALAPVAPLETRAYGPAGTTLVSTVGDLLRLADAHLRDPSLASLRAPQAAVALHGWLDDWCLGWARFDWGGRHVWGWDGVVPGERVVLRLLPDERAALVLATNDDAGRRLYRSLFAELVPPLLGLAFPELRLEPSGPVRNLSRFAGSYGWPDRRFEVAVADDRLRIAGDGVEREAVALDGRSFLVDRADPDIPTLTFGAFDGAGRPQVLYHMLWGLPRL
jgi:CubicO group peptidase (beta-lactamase class C family)